jgi:hypothetical protein
MRFLMQIAMAFVVALVFLIALVVALSVQAIKMLTESEGEAAEDAGNNTEWGPTLSRSRAGLSFAGGSHLRAPRSGS